MLNIVIPCAGGGKRFLEAGYSFPKPLTDVNGAPMVQRVVENLNFNARYIFLVQEEHRKKYNIDNTLKQIAGKDCIIIGVNGITQGAACTVLLAKEYINNEEELLIANCDQIIKYSKDNFNILREWTASDGIIFTFHATHPKWSFAKLDKSGRIIEVAEKNPISNVATVGAYQFKRGDEFVLAAEQMIRKNIRTNNEFYLAPVYNEMIEGGKIILPYFVDKMYGIGTPEDLQNYLNSIR